MTSREFIAKNFSTYSDKQRECSSVMADHHGSIYSYGYHYPLLFKVGGLNFVNTAGYSNTTAKHIGWAWSAVRDRGEHAIGIDLPSRRGYYPVDYTLEDLRNILLKQHASLSDQMVAKKRKDTSIYRDLETQADRVSLSLMTVQGVL